MNQERKPGRTVAVLTGLCLVVVAVAGLVAMDPGFLVAAVPGWFSGPTSVGRTLQVAGGLTLLTPILAAVVAHSRGQSRAAGFFVVLAVMAFLPAILVMDRGATKVRHAVETPDSEPCAEFSGGGNRCPGG